jgi:hypothetical protein
MRLQQKTDFRADFNARRGFGSHSNEGILKGDAIDGIGQQP